MFESNEFENLGFAIIPNLLDNATISFLNEKLEAFEIGKKVKHRAGAS